MSREDQYNVTVVVGSSVVGQLGTFDKMSGGEIDSEEAKYRPGNMGAEISLGGYRMVTNITLSRLFVQGRDTGVVEQLLMTDQRVDQPLVDLPPPRPQLAAAA